MSRLVCSDARRADLCARSLSLDAENAGLGHTRKSALMPHYVMPRDVAEMCGKKQASTKDCTAETNT